MYNYYNSEYLTFLYTYIKKNPNMFALKGLHMETKILILKWNYLEHKVTL